MDYKLYKLGNLWRYIAMGRRGNAVFLLESDRDEIQMGRIFMSVRIPTSQ